MGRVLCRAWAQPPGALGKVGSVPGGRRRGRRAALPAVAPEQLPGVPALLPVGCAGHVGASGEARPALVLLRQEQGAALAVVSHWGA